MYKQIVDNRKTDMDGLEHLNQEMGKIRTGRANSALVESLMVDYYGSKTPLKQIASINIPEARLIVIQPWDKDSLVSIESALRESDLGFNPSNDGQVIRINIPQLTEERRKELVKALNQRSEDAKIAIRNIREEAWTEIQEEEKAGKCQRTTNFQGKIIFKKLLMNITRK